MKLDKLPAPDGAVMNCTVELNIPEWPYVRRCRRKAAGLLPVGIYEKLRARGINLGGRLICQEHADELNKREVQ